MTIVTRREESSVPKSPERALTSRVVRLGPRISFRYRPRSLFVTIALCASIFVLLIAQLSVGDYKMSPSEVLSALAGTGTDAQDYIVNTLRLPRALTAILVGAAFGLSGAIFQSMTRNPLGSPDIIGFTQGASLGAVTVFLIYHGSQLQVALGALGGGFAISALVYVLSYRKGVQGYRLILVGIGVTAVLTSLVSYVLLQAKVEDAQLAYIWLTGSLNGRSWEHALPVAVGLLVLIPLTLSMSRRMHMMEMGDDVAFALGIPVERTRLLMLFLGTALCAVAVSAVGPVGFVALAAPQIAKRVTGSATITMLPSAAMGSALLLGCDLLAQRLIAPKQLPVGVATLAVGGLYLAWLLFRENRSGRG